MVTTLASSLVFANPQWMWIAVVFGVVALIFLIVNYSNSHLRGGWKALAIVLKLAAFALLASALLEPVWVDEFPRNGANDLVLIADNSRGLAIENQGESLKNALVSSDPDNPPSWLTGLNDMFRVQNYQFDRRLQRVDDFSKLDFSGNASSVLTSLKSLKSRYEKRPLAAMVVFSDGNATDTAAIDSVLEALKSASEERIPVYPVLVGKNLANIRDLSIREVDASQSAFEDAPLTIFVQADARGTFEHGVEIFALDDKGEEVIREPIIFAGDGEIRSGSTRLRISGVKPGISFYTVGIRPVLLEKDQEPAPEVTMENNQQLVAVDRGPWSLSCSLRRGTSQLGIQVSPPRPQ